MHRPPRGETPRERDQSQRRAPPPPPPQPCLATSPPTTGLGQGAHLTGTTGGKGTRKGRGARKRGAQLCHAKCRATIRQQQAGRATESTRSPVNDGGSALASPHACCFVPWLPLCDGQRCPCFLLVAMLLRCFALPPYPRRTNGPASVAVANANALQLPLPLKPG